MIIILTNLLTHKGTTGLGSLNTEEIKSQKVEFERGNGNFEIKYLYGTEAHRYSGPAAVSRNYLYYARNGQLYRENGAVYVSLYLGSVQFYSNGQLSDFKFLSNKEIMKHYNQELGRKC